MPSSIPPNLIHLRIAGAILAAIMLNPPGNSSRPHHSFAVAAVAALKTKLRMAAQTGKRA